MKVLFLLLFTLVLAACLAYGLSYYHTQVMLLVGDYLIRFPAWLLCVGLLLLFCVFYLVKHVFQGFFLTWHRQRTQQTDLKMKRNLALGIGSYEGELNLWILLKEMHAKGGLKECIRILTRKLDTPRYHRSYMLNVLGVTFYLEAKMFEQSLKCLHRVKDKALSLKYLEQIYRGLIESAINADNAAIVKQLWKTIPRAQTKFWKVKLSYIRALYLSGIHKQDSPLNHLLGRLQKMLEMDCKTAEDYFYTVQLLSDIDEPTLALTYAERLKEIQPSAQLYACMSDLYSQQKAHQKAQYYQTESRRLLKLMPLNFSSSV